MPLGGNEEEINTNCGRATHIKRRLFIKPLSYLRILLLSRVITRRDGSKQAVKSSARLGAGRGGATACGAGDGGIATWCRWGNHGVIIVFVIIQHLPRSFIIVNLILVNVLVYLLITSATPTPPNERLTLGSSIESSAPVWSESEGPEDSVRCGWLSGPRRISHSPSTSEVSSAASRSQLQ